MSSPEFILFAQHGWADDNRAMLDLAHQLVPDTIPIVAPSLNYLQTWLRISPLIEAKAKIALEQIAAYPDLPLRIVGHSMGGLIWLEILNRHPELWERVHSLVLVASPVGGADLGRLIDPISLGIGIAADLGMNRKPIAEKIAAAIPTLVIAGDIDGGSDGTVPVECTKFANARFVCLSDLSHPVLRNHPAVAAVIRDFWEDNAIGESIVYDDVVRLLHQVPGMTDGHWRNFDKAEVAMQLEDGSTIRTWQNWMGIDHVFVASPEGTCLYAGFVGWLHAQDLCLALDEIKHTYAIASTHP